MLKHALLLTVISGLFSLPSEWSVIGTSATAAQQPQTGRSNISSRVNQGTVRNEIYRSPIGSGFNNFFIAQYLLGLHGQCPNCWTNMHPMAKADIENALNQIRGTSLHHFREGLILGDLFPTSGVVRYVDNVAEILRLYQEHGATVILTFGNPVPTWMANTAPWCPMPAADTEWAGLKNNLSIAIGSLVSSLWNHPQLNKDWMKNHLIIEPFNEFDSLETPNGAKCAVGNGTGRRAAELSGGIQFVLRAKGVPLAVTTPSNVFGDLKFFKEFYESGGKGQPSTHSYPAYDGTDSASIASVDNYLNKVADYLQRLNAVLPPRYKNRVILGEYGLASLEGACRSTDRPGGVISGDARRMFLIKAFNDPRIQGMTEINLLWRATDVDRQPFNKELFNNPANPAMHCEVTLGAMRTDYSPKPQLVEYLKNNDGIDLLTDIQRLGFLRSRINNMYRRIHGRDSHHHEMAVALSNRILGDVEWSAIEVSIKSTPSRP
jgi:hypothetical protein